MATLRYFEFVLISASYIDDFVHGLVRRMYDFSKKRTPSTVELMLEYLEALFLVFYNPFYKYSSRFGMCILETMDRFVDEGVAKIEGVYSTEDGERVTKIRELCRAIGARISEHWERHGVVVGTLVLCGALLQTLVFLLVKFITSGPCHKLCTSEPVVRTKTYFHEKLKPGVKIACEIGHQFLVKTSLLFEVFKDKMDPIVTTVVEHEYYKKAYHYVNDAQGKIKSTKMCTDVVEFLDPYVGPTLERVWTSEVYINLKEKLTPIKEE